MEEQNNFQEPQQNQDTKETQEKQNKGQAENTKKKEKEKRTILITLLIFAILLFLIIGFKGYLSKSLPEYQMNKGKQYYEQGQYEKAIRMFDAVANALPHDYESIYYKALALSKMPATLENQKALYEIAWLDDCDKANEVAEKALEQMRWKLNEQIGPNYIDNVLYEDKLVRWNKSEPITYNIKTNSSVPQNYYADVKSAFDEWQSQFNKDIVFREVKDNSAKISDNNIKNQKSGNTVPQIKNNQLVKIDIKLKNRDADGNIYQDAGLKSLAMHEIGHALGLFGHSSDPNDVMYFDGDVINSQTNYKEISERDKNTLKAIYNMIPDVIDKPLTPLEMRDMYFHNILTYYPGENFELDIQRNLEQLRNNGGNIIQLVNLAIDLGYRKQYERSNYILTQSFPLIVNDLGNQFVVLYNIAVNYYKMRDYKQSEKYLNYATNINDDKDTQTLEAFIDYRLNRTELAKSKLILLNKTYPTDIEIALKLANVYYRLDKPNEEKEVIDNIIRNNPEAIKDRRISKYRKQRVVSTNLKVTTREKKSALSK